MSAREKYFGKTEKADALPMEEPAVLIITVKWVFLGTTKLSVSNIGLPLCAPSKTGNLLGDQTSWPQVFRQQPKAKV